MKYNFFIQNNAFDERIKRLIELGTRQGGYIRYDQLVDELKNVDVYDSQLEILHEKLMENNIIIKTVGFNDSKKANNLKRKGSFIDESEVDMRIVNQVDKCLSFNELKMLFLAKYDEKMSKRDKKIIKQGLANRIVHVESCHDCLTWCQFGLELYKELCNDCVPFPNKKFFEIFDDDYQSWLRKKGTKISECKQNGHVFEEWVYYECPKENSSLKYQEWSRICKRCKYIEKLNSEPEELKAKKLIKK